MPDLPSQWADEVLSGRVALDDAPDSIRSWLRFWIYRKAVDIVRMPSKDARAGAIDVLPASLRELVGAEVRRVWEWRGEV